MSAAVLRGMRFTKMHGAGNDFVILDLRAAHGRANAAGAGSAGAAGDTLIPDVDMLRKLADRHRGVGCDQVIGITDPVTPGSVAAYRIWNTDGSIAQQCGNGVRCVAAWLLRDGAVHADAFVLDSPAGSHAVQANGGTDFTAELGVPDFTPARIPLEVAAEQSDYWLDVLGVPTRFGAVSMGNPHALIVVSDIAAAPVRAQGAAMQAMREFPDSINVGFAQVLARDRVALRVYERGVGETLACGSGACAAVAILVRQGRVDREVSVELPGGTLRIAWPSDDAPVSMRGPAVFVFEGEWNP